MNELEKLLTIELKKTGKEKGENYQSLLLDIDEIDLTDLFDIFCRNEEFSFFSSLPAENKCILAAGIAEYFSSEEKKQRELFAWREKTFSMLERNVNTGDIPLVFGYEQFPLKRVDNSIWSDFHFSEWILPRFIFFRENEKSRLIYNYQQGGDSGEHLKWIKKIISVNKKEINAKQPFIEKISDPLIQKSEWKKSMDKILKEIHDEAASKVVLSRYSKYRQKNIDISAALGKLQKDYPACHTFAISRNSSIFFGATPETLLSSSGGRIYTDALAGSAPRGKNREEEERIEDELKNSEKILNEHYYVREFIKSTLTQNSVRQISIEGPFTKKLKNIQHLHSPVRGIINGSETALSIAGKLHPTPAVCGLPRENSLEILSAAESYSRGLYSGMIGWFTADDTSLFSVAIRSALLKGEKLFIFAGCGIVAGSDADNEFEESELKMDPILNSIGV